MLSIGLPCRGNFALHLNRIVLGTLVKTLDERCMLVTF